MKRRLVGFIIAACATALVPSFVGAGERWLLSIPRLDVKEASVPGLPKPRRESIVGIKVTVSGGGIVSLPEIPVGWNIVIDNDPSWTTTLTATVLVASAALEPEYVSRNFVVVSKAPAGMVREPGQPEIQVELALSADFEHQRRVILGQRQVLLTRE